jgi:serine/threonine protein kinase
MTRESDPDKLLPGDWVAGFRVVKRLGGGTYGVVYQVEKDGLCFALKLAVHREASRDELRTDERTQRELACLLVLNHPNIARVWGHGRWPHPCEGYLYLVLDYVEGFTLAEWVEQTCPTPYEVVRLSEKVAAALAYAHGLDILHRDIKPSNIVIRARDGEPVLIDFGAATFPLGPELTDQRLAPGTLRHTTPEALRFDHEHRHDPAARYQFKPADDIYALGITLYDVLTEPRLKSSPRRLPVSHWAIPPTPAMELNPRVPVALSQLVDLMIARDPALRPVSMERVRRWLGEFTSLPGEEWKQRTVHPASAQLLPAVSGPRASSALSRRLPWAAAVAGLVVLTTLLLLGVSGALRWSEPGSRPMEPQQPAASAPPLPEVAPSVQPPPPAPALTTEQQTAPPPPPPKKGSAMTSPLPLPSSSETLCQRRKPPPRGTSEFRAWCKCAAIVGTLTAASAGCAGAPPRADPGSCPEETVATMKEVFGLGIRNMAGFITLGTEPAPELPNGLPYVPIKEGPLTALVIRANSKNQGPGRLPKGTLLSGYVWTDTGLKDRNGVEHALIRFTSVTTPDGKTYPVCIVGFDDDGSTLKHAGSRHGVAVLQKFGYIFTVKDWPPPPGPHHIDGN